MKITLVSQNTRHTIYNIPNLNNKGDLGHENHENHANHANHDDPIIFEFNDIQYMSVKDWAKREGRPLTSVRSYIWQKKIISELIKPENHYFEFRAIPVWEVWKDGKAEERKNKLWQKEKLKEEKNLLSFQEYAEKNKRDYQSVLKKIKNKKLIPVIIDGNKYLHASEPWPEPEKTGPKSKKPPNSTLNPSKSQLNLSKIP